MQNLLGVGVISQTLAHLLSIATQYQSRDDQVFPRSRVEQMGSEDDEGVEPSSGLVDPLGDEIGRESSLELLFRGAKGVVLLRVRHAVNANRQQVSGVVQGLEHETGCARTFPTRTNNQTPRRHASDRPCPAWKGW